MSILIGSLEFQGPIRNFDYLSDISGVYGVLCQNRGEFELIELGDSEFVREYIQNHPDRQAWSQNGLDISICVHYTSELSAAERAELKDTLEREFDAVDAAA
jgi:hypothetical protein